MSFLSYLQGEIDELKVKDFATLYNPELIEDYHMGEYNKMLQDENIVGVEIILVELNGIKSKWSICVFEESQMPFCLFSLDYKIMVFDHYVISQNTGERHFRSEAFTVIHDFKMYHSYQFRNEIIKEWFSEEEEAFSKKYSEELCEIAKNKCPELLAIVKDGLSDEEFFEEKKYEFKREITQHFMGGSSYHDFFYRFDTGIDFEISKINRKDSFSLEECFKVAQVFENKDQIIRDVIQKEVETLGRSDKGLERFAKGYQVFRYYLRCNFERDVDFLAAREISTLCANGLPLVVNLVLTDGKKRKGYHSRCWPWSFQHAWHDSTNCIEFSSVQRVIVDRRVVFERDDVISKVNQAAPGEVIKIVPRPIRGHDLNLFTSSAVVSKSKVETKKDEVVNLFESLSQPVKEVSVVEATVESIVKVVESKLHVITDLIPAPQGGSKVTKKMKLHEGQLSLGF